jgi:phosphate-selective porin OprO/OprP
MVSTRKSFWTRILKGLQFAGVVATLGLGTASNGVAADDPFEELRLRIEQLEQDNRELRSALAPRTISDLEPVAGAVPPSPDDDEPPTEEEARIGSIVERYLQRRPSMIDSSQDQNISALQGSVTGILDRLNKKTYPTVQVNGVFQADAGFFNQDSNSLASYGLIQNGADFRRARLSAKGALTETTNYFFQMDFAFFGRPTFTDVWVEQTEIPWLGTVRVGQWKQPFSLEVVSSFRYTTFAERSLLFQAFTPFRHLGTGFYNHSSDLSATWAASVFATGQDQYGDTIMVMGGVGTAERITFLPYWDECSQGRHYGHIGFGHYFNAPPNHVGIFRTIPELYIGTNANGVVGTSGQAAPGAFNGTPFFVNTGNLAMNYYNVWGTEILWVEGPFSFQSEGMLTVIDQAGGAGATPVTNAGGGPTAYLAGMYAQAGYFLTGEHRPYDRKAGAIDRIKPNRNFSPWHECDGGLGAWEVAQRFSYIDLNDKNIRGGRMHDFTTGVNWYLNPYWKMQFNYIYSISDFSYSGGNPANNAPGPTFLGNHTSIFDIRCQMDF